jgi:hypothetical protein
MLPAHKAALAKLALVGLQQRLLSSISAFLRTLKTHRKTLQRLIEGEQPHAPVAAVQAFVDGSTTDKPEELTLEDEGAEQVIDADEGTATEAASIASAAEASAADLNAELAAVDAMRELAEKHARQGDARVRWLIEWCVGGLAT